MKNTNNTNTNNINNMMTEAAIKEKYLKGNNIKLQLARFATIMMIIAALLISRSGLGAQKKDFGETVYDDALILSLDDTVNVIESRNAALSELTGNRQAKIIVVVEKGRSSYKDLEKKADKLFGTYKAGDNGMLFIVSVPNSKSSGLGEDISEFFTDLFGGGTQPYAYHTGRNFGDSFDNKIDDIFMDNFLTNYQDGRYNAAILDTFNSLADYFDEYYNIDSKNYQAEIIENNQDNNSQSNSYVSIIGIIFLFGVLFIVLGLFTKNKTPEASRVYKKPFWFGMI